MWKWNQVGVLDFRKILKSIHNTHFSSERYRPSNFDLLNVTYTAVSLVGHALEYVAIRLWYAYKLYAYKKKEYRASSVSISINFR